MANTVNTQRSLCPFVTSVAEHPRGQTVATRSGLKRMESGNLVGQLGRSCNVRENDSLWRISEGHRLWLWTLADRNPHRVDGMTDATRGGVLVLRQRAFPLRPRGTFHRPCPSTRLSTHGIVARSTPFHTSELLSSNAVDQPDHAAPSRLACSS